MTDENYDLIVVGAGAAGLAAASVGAAQGHRVLLIEHTARIGGTTAISGGMVWIPANHKMQEAGLDDSAEAARRYIDETVPGGANGERMRAFLQHGDPAIRYLEVHTALKLRPVRRYPDYYPDLPGATAGGRVLEPVPFDGRELGRDFALLRDPLPEFMLFGGMMISREDIPKLRRIGKSPLATWDVLKLIGRYGWQRLRAHRGTTLVLGNALAARLFKSARDLGVDIVTKARVVHLVLDGERVSGLRVHIGGSERQIHARAVVLATGGISHDAALRASFVPASAGQRSATANAGTAQGGVRIAQAAGAALSRPAHNVDDALAFWVPVSCWQREDGSTAMFPHTVTDRAKPGLIAVDRHGKRFVNEALSYHEFVRAQLRHADDAIPAWLVCDSRFLWKYGLGRVRPFALSTRHDVASGYLKKASTLDALAALIGVPPAAFAQTLQRFNAEAKEGRDSEFARGGDIYQRHLGDGDQHPNPCVAPIEQGPFYAVCVFPADLGMAAGLITDEHARVLRADGSPIDGLYACGNDMQSVMNGAYPGPGITLGPALVFGVIAACHALGHKLTV
ncbi:Succinate dehydrogenase/fumarate reductase, flavoprotein subunit [Paraburkholderia fungorum]|uniref:Succinate dehydrogenase/fumarate reductase, flavoprotein subunit n=1 Tax=Paraburkholderia fungorum TaxID=134537 RepID=A0A1H1JLA0_9BURK|nr:FAD-dependent oxidoreductase [Paraburkholderia fungorum]SDR50768.1 Succinate dehydrogenase/fumarate reductase, flavoprotein subunit [Paraburkholderia fungorum]